MRRIDQMTGRYVVKMEGLQITSPSTTPVRLDMNQEIHLKESKVTGHLSVQQPNGVELALLGQAAADSWIDHDIIVKIQ